MYFSITLQLFTLKGENTMSGKKLSKGNKNKIEIKTGLNLSKTKKSQEKRERKSKRLLRLLGEKIFLKKEMEGRGRYYGQGLPH